MFIMEEEQDKERCEPPKVDVTLINLHRRTIVPGEDKFYDPLGLH